MFVKLIANILTKYKIFIKPHPAYNNMLELKTCMEAISPDIEIVDPEKNILRYLDIADVIIESCGGSAANASLNGICNIQASYVVSNIRS